MAMEAQRYSILSPPPANDIIRHTRRLKNRKVNGQLAPPPFDSGATNITPEPSHFWLPLPPDENNVKPNYDNSYNVPQAVPNDAFETSDSSLKSSYFPPYAHQSESAEWQNNGQNHNRDKHNYENENDSSENEHGVSLFLPYIPPRVPHPTASPIRPDLNRNHPALFRPEHIPPISHHIQSINEPDDFSWPGPIENIPEPVETFPPVPPFHQVPPFKVFSFFDIFKLAAQQMQPNNNFDGNR